MKKWLDNYNDSHVSFPQGFVGDGIINGPKFNNGAINGQFQDGGTIPGSVGFSYARTGTTPSNGKYAKKTMPSAQNGATVQYDTPEYREAYNRGEILSDTGERSPILLDEVTLQNDYKRPRNWLEQYRDKILEENRDSGFLGAALGTPISAITSIPQLFAMKALTGEMQRPSEGLDIQNPYGAMATDAVLDPANLIGAGVLTKENTISNVLSGGKDALMSGVSKLKPKSIKPVLDENVFNQNVLDYNDLPELMEAYRDKAFKQYGRQLTDKELGLYSKLEDTKNNTSRLRPLYEDEDIYLTHDKTKLKSDLVKRNVKEIMDPFIKTHEISSDYSPREIALADAYQWGYDSNFNKRPNTITDDALFDPLIGEFEELIKKNKTKRPEKFFRNQDDYYVNNAWDKDGNVLQNKRYSELNVGDEYEPNSFVSTTLSPKNYSSGDHLLEIDIPESQSFLNMASTGNRKFYQEAENVLPKNLRFRIEEAQDYVNPDEFAFDHTNKRFRESIVNPYRDGGIIEDNRGQWAHPGEITKINSGDITMKGVNYPVLGIDNLGNKKMMKPNKDYKFPGSSVIEYPQIAKDGLQLVKLNQLTNFTNYNTPQPGGWLDKF